MSALFFLVGLLKNHGFCSHEISAKPNGLIFNKTSAVNILFPKVGVVKFLREIITKDIRSLQKENLHYREFALLQGNVQNQRK